MVPSKQRSVKLTQAGVQIFCRPVRAATCHTRSHISFDRQLLEQGRSILHIQRKCRSGQLLPTNRMHWSFRLDEARRVNLVPFILHRDAQSHCAGDLVISTIISQQIANVRFIVTKQTIPQPAICGQAKSITAVTKRSTYRGDQSDRAESVAETIPGCGCTAVRW